MTTVFWQIAALATAPGVKQLWLQAKGVTTGLACASQLTNFYLVHLDGVAESAFSTQLLFYKGYIDDILEEVY